jgi:hypothetical protein
LPRARLGDFFDAYVALDPNGPVAFTAQSNGGFEPKNFGTSAWAA